MKRAWILLLMAACQRPASLVSSTTHQAQTETLWLGATGPTGPRGPSGPNGENGLSSNALGTGCGATQLLTGITPQGVSCGFSPAVNATRRFVSLGPADFVTETPPAWTSTGTALTHESGQGTRIIAHPHLPGGARVKQIRCWVTDNLAGSTLATALLIDWMVEGQSSTPPTPMSCFAPVFSADNASLHAVTLDAANALVSEPGCTAPVGSGLFPNNPFAYTQHSIAISTSATSNTAFYGCDVAFDVTEALP